MSYSAKRPTPSGSAEPPKKPKIEEKGDEEYKEKVSLANLDPSYSSKPQYYIEVRCTHIFPLRSVNTKKGATNIFACIFADKAKDTIFFEAWGGVGEYCAGYFKKGLYYRFENMVIAYANEWDVKKAPNAKCKIKGDADPAPFISDQYPIEPFDEPTIDYISPLSELPGVLTKVANGDHKMVCCRVIGRVIEHGPLNEGVAKQSNKAYCLSKILLGDASNQAIEVALWGDTARKTRYAPGTLLEVETTQFALTNGNVELKFPKVEVIDPKVKTANKHIQALIAWNVGAGSNINISAFRNLSATVPYGTTDLASVPEIKVQDLLQYQKEAKMQIKQWEESGQIVTNDETSARELTADQKKLLPSGKFYLIGEVMNIRNTTPLVEPKPGKGAPFAQTILFPACAHPSNHPRAKKRVDYIPRKGDDNEEAGDWICKGCAHVDSKCTYGVSCNIEFSDVNTLTLRSWTLAGLLPGTTTPEGLMREQLKLKGEDENKVFAQSDHLEYDAALVKTIHNLVTSQAKVYQATIDVVPDIYLGLRFDVVAFSAPQFERECEFLTNLLQAEQI